YGVACFRSELVSLDLSRQDRALPRRSTCHRRNGTAGPLNRHIDCLERARALGCDGELIRPVSRNRVQKWGTGERLRSNSGRGVLDGKTADLIGLRAENPEQQHVVLLA